MTNASKRSSCPLACTLDLLGDRWTMLVVRDLFADWGLTNIEGTEAGRPVHSRAVAVVEMQRG